MARGARSSLNARIDQQMKCGYVGLQLPFLQLELPIELGSGIELRRDVTIDSPFWVEGLGKWKLEQLHECDLLIVASMESEKPNILDQEHSQLVERAWRFTMSLMLTGVRFNSAPVILSSSVVDGEENLRRYSEAGPWMQTDGQPYTLVDRSRISQAESVLVGIDRILSKDFRRFRKGLVSICSGLAERSCDDRAFFFARALEATQAGQKHEGKPSFVEKAQVMIGKSSPNKELLEDLYDIRSNVAHVKAFSDLVKPNETAKQAEDRIVARCSDAEIICKEVYRRILSDAALLNHFVDDDTTKAYWATNPQWFPPVNPDVIRGERRLEVEASKFSNC